MSTHDYVEARLREIAMAGDVEHFLPHLRAAYDLGRASAGEDAARLQEQLEQAESDRDALQARVERFQALGYGEAEEPR